MASVQPVPKLLPILDDEHEAPPALPTAAGLGAGLLGALGLAFLAVGLTDLVLAWLPPAFGEPEWEFGTVTATLNGLPIFVIGLALILADASRRGARRTVRVIAVACLLLAVAIVVMAALYVTVVPLALQSVPEGGVRLGLMKAMTKTSAQIIVYPILFGWIAVKAWRWARIS